MKTSAIFTLHRIAFAPARKCYRIGLPFTHKNSDFGAISVAKRSCRRPISKVERHLLDRFCDTLLCNEHSNADRSGT